MPMPPTIRTAATITTTGTSRRGRAGRPMPGLRMATLLSSVVRMPALVDTKPQGGEFPTPSIRQDAGMPAPLFHVVGEVEEHVAEAGWDQPPQLFALVDTEELRRAEPQLARTMGLVAALPGSLTPIAQEPLAEGPLDEALAGIVFGPEVLGVVLAHEVLVLPPGVEALRGDDAVSA